MSPIIEAAARALCRQHAPADNGGEAVWQDYVPAVRDVYSRHEKLRLRWQRQAERPHTIASSI